eukprot:1153682-Pelagomonas_calceolata.AAC.3
MSVSSTECRPAECVLEIKYRKFAPLKRKRKKRKFYAGHRPRALKKGPLTSKLARASPEVPQNYTSYS